MRVLQKAGLMLFPVLLQACATNAPTVALDTTPVSDSNIEAWYLAAKPLVADKLGASLSELGMEIQSKGEMYLTHKELVEQSIPTAFHAEPRQKIIESQIEDSLDNIIALYDQDKKRIVFDRENLKDHVARLKKLGHTAEQAALTVIFHELVHAADDERYDFRGLQTRRPWNALERSAVIEGHAQHVTQQLCEESNCSKAFVDDEQYLRYLPALTGTAKLFPHNRGDSVALRYVQGAEFIDALENEESVENLVDQALRRAPADALSLFDSKRFMNDSISASSESLANALAAKDIGPLSRWIKIPRAPFTQSSFPRDSDRREEYVTARSGNLLGSAMMSYYHPNGSSLLPRTIRLLQARDQSSAATESDFMLGEVRRKTAGMLGWHVSLRNIQTSKENFTIDGENANLRRFSADLYSGENSETIVYRVDILNYKNIVAEVSTFGSKHEHYRTLNVAKRLLKKQASSNACELECVSKT